MPAIETDTPRITSDAREAVELLEDLYHRNTAFLRDRFRAFLKGDVPEGRVRAFYPEIRIRTERFGRMDTRLSYGFVDEPGEYAATITRPNLFRAYLREQVGQIVRNHDISVTVGPSSTPIPIHFAFNEDEVIPETESEDAGFGLLRDCFDVPDLSVTDDAIVNGTVDWQADGGRPLAMFTAPRVDYSLHRLRHYTATSPRHFQNFVLFTNYQFYVDTFCDLAREMMAAENGPYAAFVEPGDRVTARGSSEPSGTAPARMPQMPAYHLVSDDHNGITLVNIGVGPSNAKTITDHIAVLRPQAWVMLGHCAGLRNTQKLGDYVLAHGYVREDHVLDADLPTWVPVPPLAEVQVALEQAVARETGLQGYELKKVMRTGTVATIDNRNWELREHSDMVRRFSQSRAIALDMESATIAANGLRFRVPYGTLLCVSDKPLHGELKLPGMASRFYRTQVDKHLRIGLRTMEELRRMPKERLHSRKLRSFSETAFQ